MLLGRGMGVGGPEPPEATRDACWESPWTLPGCAAATDCPSPLREPAGCPRASG